jgi:transposase
MSANGPKQVRLMPPAYVKPYVKRGKTDAADAERFAKR